MRKFLQGGSAIAAVLAVMSAATTSASAADGAPVEMEFTFAANAAETPAQSPAGAPYGDIIPFGGEVTARYGTIHPFYGQIDPFYGQIDPWYGTIYPWYGTIYPFYGTIYPFEGEIDPLYGTIYPWYGTIYPWWGEINPFQGDLDALYGTIYPFYGHINPFYGTIYPFEGELNPFYGHINPFWGQIDPFWGQINPFYGTIYPWWGTIYPFDGDVEALWGTIYPFWNEVGPLWGTIYPFWGTIHPFDNAEDLDTLVGQLQSLFDKAETVFGAAVAEQTGQSFEAGFLNDLLDRYGIDLSDPQSLLALDEVARDQFFLAFYDGLMGFSGVDHVDHWMAATGWSPALAQEAGGGARVKVGLVDLFERSSITGGREWREAVSGLDLLHGEAVASLIGAPHDGENVMGVAPDARMIGFNPFDETLTAGWEDVTTGVRALVRRNADIVNLSIGESGWTFSEGWRDVFTDNVVTRRGDDTLFVFAAGNDGLAQDADVDWTGAVPVENLIIVGSANPMGWLSGFSNRPGEACFTTDGACEDGHRLMDRFLIAPGELVLVEDGFGGVRRMSGTSFAAPLVSGAAALVKGRWNWLDAPDVADVLLESAFDLGAPGTDPVFGRGLLSIDGAMAPLDPQDLMIRTWFGMVNVGELVLAGGALNLQKFSNREITVFEPIRDTYRDFSFTIGDLLVELEQSDMDDAGAAEAWIGEQTAFGFAGFSSRAERTRPMARAGDFSITAFAAEADPRGARSLDRIDFQAGVRVENAVNGRTLEFGAGEGAFALSGGLAGGLTGGSGFNLFSDHRPLSGGVNPVLGFASGGAYLATQTPIGERTQLIAGVTTAHDERQYVDPFTGEEKSLLAGVEAYAATALNAGIVHEVSEGLRFGASYTRLMERDALLGAQGAGALGFSGGAATDAATLSAGADLSASLTLDASATFGRTAASGFDESALSLSESALSTAWQVSLTRRGVLGREDGLRASLIQPLHMESGALSYSAMSVVDRETGALGLDEQRWALGGERRMIAELLYEAPALNERASYGLFVRAENDAGAAGGLRFDLRF